MLVYKKIILKCTMLFYFLYRIENVDKNVYQNDLLNYSKLFNCMYKNKNKCLWAEFKFVGF